MQVKRMGMLQNRSYGNPTAESSQGNTNKTLIMVLIGTAGVLWLLSSAKKGA